MSIYNSTISQLQHFVTQLLLLPTLMAVNLHVPILKIECSIFADLVTYMEWLKYNIIYSLYYFQFGLQVPLQFPDSLLEEYFPDLYWRNIVLLVLLQCIIMCI